MFIGFPFSFLNQYCGNKILWPHQLTDSGFQAAIAEIHSDIQIVNYLFRWYDKQTLKRNGSDQNNYR